MSRTDAIRRMVDEALASHRATIDGDTELEAVTLLVKLDRRTRQPRAVHFRPESIHDSRPAD